MSEPETRLTLEAPAGLVEITAQCRAGKAERITLANVPAFADRLDAPLEVAGLGTLRVDVAYGGDSFVIVDAAALGFAIRPDEARDLAEAGMRIVAAANARSASSIPENPEWDHISFCQFAGTARAGGRRLDRRQRGHRAPGQDRPFADRHRLQRADGASARARPDEGRRALCRALDHRLALRLRDRGGHDGRRTAGDHAPRLGPGVDHRDHQHMLEPTTPGRRAIG